MAAPGAPWPIPANWQNSSILRTLDPGTFVMTTDAVGCDIIDDAIQRYMSLLNLDPDGVSDPGLAPIVRLVITTDNKTCDSGFYPHNNMNESCMYTNI